MATKIYLPSSGSAPVSPAYDAAWHNTTFAARLPCYDSKQSTTMTTVADTVNIKTNEDHLYRQWISEPITAQTLLAQTLKLQIRAAESNTAANLFASISVRIVSNDGNTVRGTVLSLVRDDTEFAATLTNRGYSATSTQVIATANDRIVIEIGQGGDPAGGGNHNNGTLRIGDTAASDLPDNDTATDDYNPWVEFANTITFATPPDDLCALDLTAGTPTLDSPVLEHIHDLTATDLTAAAPTLDSPVLAHIHDLAATDLTAAAPTLDSPILAHIHDLAATDLTAAAPTLDSPVIGQTHDLAATDLTAAAPTLDSPVLAHIHDLAATDLTAGTPTLDSPVLAEGGVDDLTALDLTAAAPTLDSPVIGQTHVLAATDLTAGTPTLDSPILAHIHDLAATDLTAGTPTLESPVLAHIHDLAATDLTAAAPTLDSPVIGQTHVLAATDLTAGTPTLDIPVFGIEGVDEVIALDLFFGTPLFDSPIFDAYTNTPSARTSTPILATLSSTPPSAQRTSVPY
jgi:hypothetical protein